MATAYAGAAYRPHFAHAEAATQLHGEIAKALATVRTWFMRASTRRELRTLNDHFLADIGMSRSEVAKPFWQA